MKSGKKEISVGLLGCGTVGSGVVKILAGRGELIRARVGAAIRLAKVADLRPEAAAALDLAEGVFTTDAFSVARDPAIPVVVELIGGEGAARKLILEALALGKSVVTANKALIASHGDELFKAAAEGGGELFFEPAVGGAMPVIKTLRESMAGNRVESVFGILNGTCNYILTRMTREGISYATALAEAKDRGYAEADPTLDVSGMDTVHKLAIVIAIAFGTRVSYGDIFVEGIERITPLDIAIAREFGYRIKLLAIAKNLGDRVEGRVHPTMIPKSDLMAAVNGAMNAVKIVGDAAGEMVLYGPGAGMMPTASAVVSDLVDIARNSLSGAKKRVPVFAFQPRNIGSIPILPAGEVETRYYMRFAAADRPGVLSKISGALGHHGISIQSVHQKGRKSDGAVPIVLLTHTAGESKVRAALAEIADLDVISGAPVLIRIEDPNESA